MQPNVGCCREGVTAGYHWNGHIGMSPPRQEGLSLAQLQSGPGDKHGESPHPAGKKGFGDNMVLKDAVAKVAASLAVLLVPCCSTAVA